MAKTAKDFYNTYNGKRVNSGAGWNDSYFGYQCVAGFKKFCEWAGVPVKPTPTNWADGYWEQRDDLGYSKYFDYISNYKNYRDGDWVIWDRKSASHPKSHIAMYYQGLAFGQNQGGNSGFRSVYTNFADSMGALRWKGFTVSESSTMVGIDISNWQPTIDLSKVKCDFVIVKATEGVDFIDRYCDGFFQKAKKLGKKLGFYHFARPEKNSAEAEAEFFYKQTKNYFHQAIPILDWESSGKSNVAWAKRWLDYIYKKTGVRPMIYMSESVVNAYNWSEVVSGNYGLWVAKYRDNKPDYNYDMSNAGSKPSVKHWNGYAMWQWTSSGRLDGYNGNLDCNVFYGGPTAWDKYAGADISEGWKKIEGKWYYVKDSVYLKGWRKLKWAQGTKEDWFYFGSDGAMLANGMYWIKWSQGYSWFCFDANGAMVTGKHKVSMIFDKNGCLIGGKLA